MIVPAKKTRSCGSCIFLRNGTEKNEEKTVPYYHLFLTEQIDSEERSFPKHKHQALCTISP